ncbi:hypothetical protein Cgig2_003346 [Carnegiea gigantea]|uniref:TatD related DNase n=1 Tax=Carnegiea gigantea TaxID=171969 RepID=A0A9Q1QAF8_9CARY|nr:hypothetical protein Cgig2_003346 [Carnegiea gigantea]
MGDSYPCVVPCFGVHPWYVTERSPDWFRTPYAAGGEIGLDKGSRGREIDFNVQVEVFKQQLELARELRRPASVHCVRAFGDFLDVMKAMESFPYGVILHSFFGSAEMVPELAKLSSFFLFSGFVMSMKPQKVKKLLKAVPSDRSLLETDAPDAVPRCNLDSLFLLEGDASLPPELKALGENPQSRATYALSSEVKDESKLPKELLNHPANIHNVLTYVASMLEMTSEELAELSYANAICLFSYECSKVLRQVVKLFLIININFQAYSSNLVQIRSKAAVPTPSTNADRVMEMGKWAFHIDLFDALFWRSQWRRRTQSDVNNYSMIDIRHQPQM